MPIKLSTIKPNPNNPRLIKDERFKKLVKSIQEFPKMMELRPMVINADNIVLGGNMRLKALQELGYKEIPNEWVKKASDLTEDEARRFIIADNVGFGEHDWELLANEWDVEQLEEWGLDIPNISLIDKNIDFKLKPNIHKKGNFYYISLFRAREEMGKSLEDFKKDRNNAVLLASFAADFISSIYQSNNSDLVIITTPKRSHTKKNGFHFASECCIEISKITGIEFIADVFISKNFQKINPIFELSKEVAQTNVILVDDIVTTGSTLVCCRDLMCNKNVLVLPLINNN